MEEEENKELEQTSSLATQELSLKESTENIVSSIIKSNTPKEIKDLTAEFNLAQSKRNMLRSLKLNDLLDQVSNKVSERIEYSAGEMSDRDLIEYLKVTQDILDKTTKGSSMEESADAIQLNQQNNINININDGTLNRESREKVIDVVNSILSRINKDNDSKLVNSNDEDIIEYNKDNEDQGD